MKINLLSHDNGVGLTQDVKIVKSILEPRHQCTFIDLRTGSPQPAQVNIFFEILDYRFYRSAKYNLFFPNPEWFMWPSLLKGIDYVLAKTKDAEKIFKTMNCSTIFTSFTSEDRLNDAWAGDRVYLHTAGQSTTKGTDTVFKAWKESYPRMIFTKLRDHKIYETDRKNIWTCFQRMPKEVLWNLQNKCTFHLCPSEYEGFGHYIWEAKSCGNIVITTDGAPMNEMVTDGVDGFLVKHDRTRKMNFGRLKMISKEDFQRVIEYTMTLTDDQINTMRKASRDRWEENDKYFKESLRSTLKMLK